MDEVQEAGPTLPSTPRWAKADGSSIFIGVLGLVLGWVLLFFWPITVLGDALLLRYLHDQRQLMGRIYLFLNPTVVLFSLSLLAPLLLYWTGDASFWGAGIGVPRADFGDFDLETRTEVTSYGGDLFVPVELLISIPANSMLALMCKVFGPVKGNYHGPMPTQQEAWQALETTGEEIGIADFKTGSFQLGTTDVKLGEAAVMKCMEYLVYHEPLPPEDYRSDRNSVRVALFHGECLIVRTHMREKQRDSGAVLISLIDLAKGEVFAQELNNGRH